MARRLDKIEKEIGYCEIKLEKDRRMRKQVQFLQNHLPLPGIALESVTAHRPFNTTSYYY